MQGRQTIDELMQKELIVVTGKGGVGKTAVASALGSRLASAGRRTLVLEIDPRESVHQMLGIPPSGGEIVYVAPNLYLQHLESKRVLDHIVTERVRIEFLIRKVLESPVYHHFSAGAPGLKEMAVLGHSLILVQGKVPGAPPIDVVVLGAPATGHGVALLMAPLLVAEVIRQGPIAAMTAEGAELIESEDRCGVVVVTQAEEMPVTEALELISNLSVKLDRRAELVVVNGLYPPIPKGHVADQEDSFDSLWVDRRRLNEKEMERLSTNWTGPVKEIPLFPLDRGSELTRAIEEGLGEL